jgi:hypothetical protein
MFVNAKEVRNQSADADSANLPCQPTCSIQQTIQAAKGPLQQYVRFDFSSAGFGDFEAILLSYLYALYCPAQPVK